MSPASLHFASGLSIRSVPPRAARGVLAFLNGTIAGARRNTAPSSRPSCRRSDTRGTCFTLFPPSFPQRRGPNLNRLQRADVRWVVRVNAVPDNAVGATPDGESRRKCNEEVKPQGTAVHGHHRGGGARAGR